MYTSNHPRNIAILALVFFFGMFVAGNGISAGHEQCTDCHFSSEPDEKGGDLIRTLETLCAECHKNRTGKGQHAVGVFLGPDYKGELPLINGKIECVTCHDSHVKTKGLLRINGEELCTSCHY